MKMDVGVSGHEGELTAARRSMNSMIEHQEREDLSHFMDAFFPNLSMGLKCSEDTFLPNLLSKLTREKGPRILALMNKSHHI